jgi:hypothetical protein
MLANAAEDMGWREAQTVGFSILQPLHPDRSDSPSRLPRPSGHTRFPNYSPRRLSVLRSNWKGQESRQVLPSPHTDTRTALPFVKHARLHHPARTCIPARTGLSGRRLPGFIPAHRPRQLARIWGLPHPLNLQPRRGKSSCRMRPLPLVQALDPGLPSPMIAARVQSTLPLGQILPCAARNGSRLAPCNAAMRGPFSGPDRPQRRMAWIAMKRPRSFPRCTHL